MKEREFELDDVLKIPLEQKILEEQKLKISEAVYKRLKDRRLTMNKVSNNIKGIGIAQVSRIMYGENYNINTLIKVLDYLDLEIQIISKEK